MLMVFSFSSSASCFCFIRVFSDLSSSVSALKSSIVSLKHFLSSTNCSSIFCLVSPKIVEK